MSRDRPRTLLEQLAAAEQRTWPELTEQFLRHARELHRESGEPMTSLSWEHLQRIAAGKVTRPHPSTARVLQRQFARPIGELLGPPEQQHHTRQHASIAEQIGQESPSQELAYLLNTKPNAPGALSAQAELLRQGLDDALSAGTEPCAILEAMFPEYSVEQLFESYRDGGSVATNADDDAIPVRLPRVDGQSITNGSEREVEDVNRKEFLAGLAATMAAPALLLSDAGPARLGAADVARYRQNLMRLYALDDHYGASSEVYGLTVRSLRHLRRVLETASCTPAVGDELRSITGGVMEHAGWLAFDAGQHREARCWWLEALHAARMANDTEVEVVVLASMSLAASGHGRGRESVDLARTAARIVRRDRSSPRLQSLLAAREALGHAHLGDGTATRQALDRAHAELHQGPHENDPAWLDFWGPSDLASHASRAAGGLGDLATAERSAREAVLTVDATRHPRNQALYQVNLGTVLVAQGNLDEGLPVVASAALQATDVNSGRLAAKVRAVVHELRGRHGDAPAVRELAEWTTTNLSAPSSWPTAI